MLLRLYNQFDWVWYSEFSTKMELTFIVALPIQYLSPVQSKAITALC